MGEKTNMNIFRPIKDKYLFALLVLFFVTYVGILVFFLFLSFDVFQSDVKGYWMDSENIKTPFHPFHVPGYPFLITILRFVTVDSLSPSTYLHFISFISFALALTLVFNIGKMYGANEKNAFIFAALFLFWPMVGITYVVYPLADALALFVLLLGVFCFLKKKNILAALVFAFALFVHKALWVYIAIGYLIFALRFWPALRFKILIYGALIFIPLLIFTLIGSFHHNSLTWIISSNLNVELASRSGLPFLDGLLGTFLKPGISSLVKGGILIMQFLFAFLLLFTAFRIQYNGWEWGASISIATLILMIFLNQYEIWASIRFGRLLVVPILGYLGNTHVIYQSKAGKAFVIFLAGILLVSQLFYAWYLKNYFGA